MVECLMTQERIRERQAEITRAFERLDDLEHEQNQLIERIKFLLDLDEEEEPKPEETATH